MLLLFMHCFPAFFGRLCKAFWATDLSRDTFLICGPKTVAEGFIGLNFFLNTCHLKCRTDNGLSLLLNTLQMRLVFETFGVNFINIFGAGWSGGEPAVFRGIMGGGDDLFVSVVGVSFDGKLYFFPLGLSPPA